MYNLYIQIVCLLLKLNAPTTIIITPTYSLKVPLNSRHKIPLISRRKIHPTPIAW